RASDRAAATALRGRRRHRAVGGRRPGPRGRELGRALRAPAEAPDPPAAGRGLNRVDPALLDCDTTSELSRGNPRVMVRARQYLVGHGRLRLSAVTVFERLRGYRAALREGKPFSEHLRAFEAFVASCRILPVDAEVAAVAATIWGSVGVRLRKELGDILIVA